jgi:hypothetical protein
MQGIHQRDRPRAHGENVADNPADAGCGALVGLDERWVVMRFDFENGSQAVADVDHTGILSGTLNYMRGTRWKFFQVNARAFVAAVFRPHH